MLQAVNVRQHILNIKMNKKIKLLFWMILLVCMINYVIAFYPCESGSDCNIETVIPCQLSSECGTGNTCNDQDGDGVFTCYSGSSESSELHMRSHNVDYNKNKIDAYGFYFYLGSADYHNAPGSSQISVDYGGSFDSVGNSQKDAWTLKKVIWPTGATTQWVYEEDQWFTAPGDEADPVSPSHKNYYARQRDDPSCYSNFGGGLRVKSELTCNGIGDCQAKFYDYTMYDEELGCVRTSGSADVVPYIPSDESEYDTRRPSHSGGPYTSGGVIYNVVTEKLTGINGFVKRYFTTTDSTPENTGGIIDFNAEDEKLSIAAPGNDYMGTARTISNALRRGLEYKKEAYSDDENMGRKGLLSEKKVEFTTNKHFDYSFGGIKLHGLNTFFNDEIVYPGRLKDKAYGYKSATMIINSISTRIYDVNTNNYYETITSHLAFDPKTGMPTIIKSENFDKDKLQVMNYAYNYVPELETNGAFALPGTLRIYEDSIANGNLKSASKLIYEDFGGGRVYLSTTKSWKDLDDDGVDDVGEWMTTSLINSYDDYGQSLETQDSKGNKVFIRYNPDFFLPSKGWNTAYGSDANPTWTKTYNDYGLIESVTDEQGMTKTYEYDGHLSIVKTIITGDTSSDPSEEIIYHSYESPTNPNWRLTKQKLSSGVYMQTKSFTDGWSQDIQVQKWVEGNNWLVYMKEFNAHGKYRDYKPFIAATNGDYYTDTPTTACTEYHYYDGQLNLVKTKILFDGTNIQYIYGSKDGYPTITVKDEMNRVSRYTYDLLGNIISVEQGFTGNYLLLGFENLPKTPPC